MTANKTGEETRRHRPWWKKKRWWVVAGYLAYLLVPYSFYGPAASCITSQNARWFQQAVMSYAKTENYFADKVLNYVQNSGYRIRNIDIKDKNYTVVFDRPRNDMSCFPIGFSIIDRKIIRLDISKEAGRSDRIERAW
ncbi:hypothetical protein [Salaquimonas pukyongi]|uniref:hypothetical protein n=1 Tax=Salaquimonas pukyongi TaxID=2712698 RepID=UPI0012ECAABC|nr:hypothetical protein [Salaquimonas pukyongi]